MKWIFIAAMALVGLELYATFECGFKKSFTFGTYVTGGCKGIKP